uniref:Uncharacterized protein n=1 Tax=Plectus sambesii TaxID=2011161 RepID=A0A914W1Z4_9BILA
MDGRRLGGRRPGRYDPFMKCGRAGGRVRANMRRQTTPTPPSRTATGGAGRPAQSNYKCRTWSRSPTEIERSRKRTDYPTTSWLTHPVASGLQIGPPSRGSSWSPLGPSECHLSFQSRPVRINRSIHVCRPFRWSTPISSRHIGSR